MPASARSCEFDRALRGDDGRRLAGRPSLLLDLLDSNLASGTSRTPSRGPDASESVVADAKRGIDELNLARHRLVQEIDAAVPPTCRHPAATLATESPGMAFDRLSVLVIRIARTAVKARSGVDEAGIMRPAPRAWSGSCSALRH